VVFQQKTHATLGAENISTQCFGGIQHDGQLWPVSLNATFTHDAKGERVVVLKGRDSCEMNVKLIKTILATIDHEVVSSHVSCWGPQGRYQIEVALK
jgi:hypothetical protein